MNFKKVLVALLVLPMGFVACSDDDDETPAPVLTDQQKLTKYDWIMTEAKMEPGTDVDGDGSLNQDLYALTPSCIQDNIFRFTENNEYSIVEGATKCDPNHSDNYEVGKYTLDNKILKVVENGTTDTTVYTVISLSTSKMVATSPDAGPYPNQLYTLTFERHN